LSYAKPGPSQGAPFLAAKRRWLWVCAVGMYWLRIFDCG
jgi:hypothetical protein